MKEAKKEAVVVRVIEDSDEEESEAPQQQIENNKLKKEIKELRVKLDKLRNVRAERNKYHELWFDNLSEKEQKQEEERWLKEQEKVKDEESEAPQQQTENNKLKEEFEAMRLKLKEIQSQGYPELKLAYSEVKERAQEMADEKRLY